jgi:hypothetical protein
VIFSRRDLRGPKPCPLFQGKLCILSTEANITFSIQQELFSDMTRFCGDAIGVRSSGPKALTKKDLRKNLEKFQATGGGQDAAGSMQQPTNLLLNSNARA